MAGRPRPSRHLDHVSATPLTAVKRARWLTASYHPDGAGALGLGDHDLAALALLLLRPDLHVTVVDVDERPADTLAEPPAEVPAEVARTLAALGAPDEGPNPRSASPV